MKRACRLALLIAASLGFLAKAHAEVRVGVYTGDGTSGRAITGLGFQPEVVILKGDHSIGVGDQSSAVLATSAMPAGMAKPLKGNQALVANAVQSLDVDGFTVGNDARSNQNGVEYYYTAFRAGRNLEVGSYVGSGGPQSLSGFGFTPDYIIVGGAGTQEALQRSYQVTGSFPFSNAAVVSNAITTLSADGFSLGPNNATNQNGQTFYYVAWNEVPGKMRSGWYFGDGLALSYINDVGFRPEYSIVKSVDQNVHAIQRFSPMANDTSINFMNATVSNRIQTFEPGGFRVGTDAEVNTNGGAYFYVAFGNDSKPPLVTSESPGKITIVSPDYFDMTFSTSAGGGIEEFHDLSSGENSDLDLAGGTNVSVMRSLFFDTLFVGGDWYNSSTNDIDPKLDLLEATATRVRVRQETFFKQEFGTAIQPGVKAHGDYSIYGTGRLALNWEKRTTLAVSTTAEHLGLGVHFQNVAPLNGWSAYAELGTGADDFLLAQIEDSVFGTYTDFLPIVHRDWSPADGVQWLTSAPDEWGILVWEDATGRVLGSVETIDLAMHFKPTDFVDPTDPKVLGRRDDYRMPDPLAVTVGAGWVENPLDGDFFNESEAAYTLDMDPAAGLVFDMDGAVTTRHAPFLKIRQWRSLADPPHVLLEDVILRNDAEYMADVKPVSRAHFADNLLWHSTLEDPAAVTAPSVGGAGAIAGAPAFVTARYGRGARFDVPAQSITFPGTGNLATAQGTVELWLQPQFDHDDNGWHHFWTYYVDPTQWMYLRKTDTNHLMFEIRHGGGSSAVVVPPADYSWRAFDWIHLRVDWNSSAPLGDQVRLFIDGVEPPHMDPTVAYTAILPNTGTSQIGADETGTVSANALIDEFKVYGTQGEPQILAHGGLASSPNEYFGTGSRSFAMNLGTLDGFARGPYLYFGADSPFHGLNVALETAGIGAVDLHWEYWDGAGWRDLESVPGFVDETVHFTQNGSIYWAVDPPGWSLYSINGDVDLYYVRVHLESGTYATIPVEARIATDILLFQYCDDIIDPAQTFSFDLPPNPDVTISSANDQFFTVGQPPPTVAAPITVTDVNGGAITAGGDIRIRIPAGLPFHWDTTVTGVGLVGSAAGKVDPNVAYEDLDRTVVLDVTADFAAGDQIQIGNLGLLSFTAPSAPDNLELEIANDGIVTAYDDKFVVVQANTTPVLSSEFDQWFTVGQPPASAATLYVTEGTTPFILAGNDIVIRIPGGFPMFWDTSITTATIGGSAASRVSASVSYEAGNRGLIINVTSDFLPGEFISISGLGFTGFASAALPANLTLDVVTAVDTDDKTIAIDEVADVPFFTATATDLRVDLEWVTPSVGTCVEIVIVRRQGADPTPTMGDWFATIPCPGLGVRMTTMDAPPLNDFTYTYGAFVHDGLGTYSTGRLLKARPFSTAGRVKWAYSTAAAAMAPPGLRFSGGAATVYAVSNDSILHSVRGGAGGGMWPAGWIPYQLGGPAQARPPVVGFTVDTATNGVAFLGAQDGKVYAIDADTGTETWSRSIATIVQAAPAGNFLAYHPLAHDLVLAATRNSTGPNSIEALNVDDGTPVWSFTNAPAAQDIGIISGSPSVDYSTRRLFFASRENASGSANTVWCVDFDSGSPNLAWARAIGNIDGSTLLYGGVLYVGTNAGTLYALDPATGNTNWMLPLGDGPIKGFPFPDSSTNSLIVSTTNNVWSITDLGASAVVNPDWPVTGATIPSPSTPTYVPGSGQILVGSGDGHLYQIDAANPLSIMSVQLGDGTAAVGTPTVDLLNSMIYVGTLQGVIYGVEFPLP